MQHSERGKGRRLKGRRRLISVGIAVALAVCGGRTGAERAVRLSDAPDYHWVKMLHHVEMFDDFERPELGSFWKLEGAKGELTDQRASQGTRGLRVTFKGAKDTLVYSRTGLDGWGGNYPRTLTVLGARFLFYNEFKFDVCNLGKEDVGLRATIGGPFDFTLKPGWNTITIRSEDIARYVYRMTKVTESMRYSVPAGTEATLVFDYFRLERESIGPTMEQTAKCFDFGPEDMCRPGFVAVDHHCGYDSRKGYGWKTPNEKDERDALMTVVSDGRDPLDDLLRDGVENLTSSFLVDVPNGKYRVLVAGGPRWGGIYQITPADYDLVVKAEGEIKRVSLRTSDQGDRGARYYGGDQAQYFFDEDTWKLFGAPMFQPFTFDAEVNDGRLEVEFQSSPRPGRGYLNFMVVYPLEKAGDVEQELNRLWYDISNRFSRVSYRPMSAELATRLRPPGVHEEMLDPGKWKEAVELATSKTPSSRKVLFFGRSNTEAIYPDTIPRPEELTEEVSGRGFGGDKVQLTVGVFALTELHDVGLQVTALEGPGSIRGEDIDTRVVGYSRRMTGQQTIGDWQYMIVPWYLVKRETMDFDRGMSRRVSLDVNLPENVRPGTYRGYLHLRFGEQERATVRISVEALAGAEIPGTTLDRVMVFHHQPSDRGDEAYGYSVSVQNTTGMPWSHVQKTRAGFSEMNRKEMAAEMRLLEEAGFKTLYFTDWLDDCREASRTLERPMELVELLTVRRRLAAKALTVEGKSFKITTDMSTARAYLRGPEECREAVIEALHQDGMKVYLGVPSEEMYLHETAAVNRLLAGLYPWRVKADGVVFGPFRSNWGNPYEPFDGPSGEPGSFALPSSKHWPEPNPSTQYYAVREGYQDYLCVTTLEDLVKRAGERPAAEEARKFLAELRESLDADLGANLRRTGTQGQLDLKETSVWTGAKFDHTRTRMMELIYTLNRSLSMPP